MGVRLRSRRWRILLLVLPFCCGEVCFPQNLPESTADIQIDLRYDCEDRGLLATVIDAKGSPVAGVNVYFSVPDRGVAVSFPGGARRIWVTTDEKGRAAARGLRPLPEKKPVAEPEGKPKVESFHWVVMVETSTRTATATFEEKVAPEARCIEPANSQAPARGSRRDSMAQAAQKRAKNCRNKPVPAQNLKGVRLRDQYWRPLPQHPVTFECTACSFDSGANKRTVSTDKEGKAFPIGLIAGSKGSFSVVARAQGLTEKEIKFISESCDGKLLWLILAAAGGGIAAAVGAGGGGGGGTPSPTTPPPPPSVTVTFGQPTIMPPR